MKDNRKWINQWEFSKKFGSPKDKRLVVVSSHQDRRNTFNDICKIFRHNPGTQLIEAISGDGPSYRFYICVSSYLSKEPLSIEIQSCEHSFNFRNRLMGNRFREVIATKRGFEKLSGIDLSMIYSVIPPYSCGLDSSLMFRILNGGLFCQLPYNEGESWVEDFDFPASLYRTGMEQYFKDPVKPTREEFLLAITLEGVNGVTEKEISAVEEAKLYCQG